MDIGTKTLYDLLHMKESSLLALSISTSGSALVSTKCNGAVSFQIQLKGYRDCKCCLHIYVYAVADLHTKVSGAPPQQDQILLFLHMFSPKSACVGCWLPLQ